MSEVIIKSFHLIAELDDPVLTYSKIQKYFTKIERNNSVIMASIFQHENYVRHMAAFFRFCCFF